MMMMMTMAIFPICAKTTTLIKMSITNYSDNYHPDQNACSNIESKLSAKLYDKVNKDPNLTR